MAFGLPAALLSSGAATRDAPITDSNILLAPCVWKVAWASAEATMPGVYLRADVTRTDRIELCVDGTVNSGAATSALPIIDCSIDGGPLCSFRLNNDTQKYIIPVGESLNSESSHHLDLVFRSAPVDGRWPDARAHLRITGLRVSDTAQIEPCSRLPHNAIAFGGSITEGVITEGPGPYYKDLKLNNSRVTWCQIACAALQSEYGQLGTGGQEIVRPLQFPPLPASWDRYDSGTSRLVAGKLKPETDYIFCFMGTNDGDSLNSDWYAPRAWKMLDIEQPYVRWLAEIRQPAALAAIYCIIPPFGLHQAQIKRAVFVRRTAGDAEVFVIDTTCFREGFVPLQFEPDGVTYTLLKKAHRGLPLMERIRRPMAMSSWERLLPQKFRAPSRNQGDKLVTAVRRRPPCFQPGEGTYLWIFD